MIHSDFVFRMIVAFICLVALVVLLVVAWPEETDEEARRMAEYRDELRALEELRATSPDGEYDRALSAFHQRNLAHDEKYFSARRDD